MEDEFDFKNLELTSDDEVDYSQQYLINWHFKSVDKLYAFANEIVNPIRFISIELLTNKKQAHSQLVLIHIVINMVGLEDTCRLREYGSTRNKNQGMWLFVNDYWILP